jgi:hypothetical protein
MSRKILNKPSVVRVASELEALFQRYSAENADVFSAFKRCRGLIDRAKSGLIIESGEKLDATYFSPEFDLVNYKDLFEKAAELDMYLEGWKSEDEYNEHMEKLIGKH